MRIVFMGTPEFALPSLRRLVEDGYDIVGVYTRADQPAGRGRTMTPPPVQAGGRGPPRAAAAGQDGGPGTGPAGLPAHRPAPAGGGGGTGSAATRRHRG